MPALFARVALPAGPAFDRRFASACVYVSLFMAGFLVTFIVAFAYVAGTGDLDDVDQVNGVGVITLPVWVAWQGACRWWEVRITRGLDLLAAGAREGDWS